MPKRTDLHKILVIGAGPIVIGQGCEFDYSGSQAVKALKEEGYEVVLVNSNPATIMTDPHMADATYIEPIEQQTLAAIIRKERPDALLPTLADRRRSTPLLVWTRAAFWRSAALSSSVRVPKSSKRPKAANCSGRPWRTSA